MDLTSNQVWTAVKDVVMFPFSKENWQFLAEHGQEFVGKIAGSPFFWGVIVLLFLLCGCRCHRLRRGKVFRTYTTNHGLVLMKESALKGVVKKICREIIPQAKARIKICVRWRKIHLQIAVASPYNMQTISVQLQQVISRVLREEVGIGNLGKVSVVIEKIIGPVKIKAVELEAIANGADIAGGNNCKPGNNHRCEGNFSKI
jgi:hypothetical protein